MTSGIQDSTYRISSFRGLMDLPAIFAAARDGGARWFIVEQDTCKRPPLESAAISIGSLRQAGLV